MAAVVQNYIRTFEEKSKPYLREGPLVPLWNLLEAKTKLRREQLALGFLGFLIIYLIFGWGNDFLCNFIGFLYPAFASVLAIESRKTDDDTAWLFYWVVYSSFGFVEYFGYNFFHSLPLYWLLKCLFLLWLMVPGAHGGSQQLYNRLVKPVVLKYQPIIDKHAQDGK